MSSQLITIFGGTGFLGNVLARELVDAGQRVRIAVRNPVLPGWVEDDDRIELVSADITDATSINAAIVGADSVVNAVSRYVASPELSVEAIHVDGAGQLARLVHQTGIEKLVHISGIGATIDSPSAYVCVRARGEDAVLDAMPRATIVRCSVLFGPGDSFLATLASLTRLPVIPLFGDGETRLQPVHVVDVARALIRLLGEPVTKRRFFELGGPDIMTYRDILSLVLAHYQVERPMVAVPFLAWRTLAAMISWLPSPPLTRDQVILMQSENRVDDRMGTFNDLGIRPRALRDSLLECLAPSKP
ncbi:complex I NDUFA9 subunit family protein [Halomonas sp.]|uniref:complex I NDUFA9 subunit family protein n=1 Tax=Halomonas sp. TaxID=1486246 RepID=UPI00356556BA